MCVGFFRHFSTNISLSNGCFVLSVCFDAGFFLSVLFNGFDLAKWLCFVLMFVCAFFSAALYLLSPAIGERKVHDMRVLTISIRIKYGPLINQLTRHESAD